MKKTDIEALPNDVATLQSMIVKLTETIESHELAKRQRAIEATAADSSPAANFQMEAFSVKRDLEGLADGSEDFTDPLFRGSACRAGITLIDKMLAALPKQ